MLPVQILLDEDARECLDNTEKMLRRELEA